MRNFQAEFKVVGRLAGGATAEQADSYITRDYQMVEDSMSLHQAILDGDLKKVRYLKKNVLQFTIFVSVQSNTGNNN